MKEAMKIRLAGEGSEYGSAAVDEAAIMVWPVESELKMLSVAEMPTPVIAGPLPMPSNYFAEWEKALEEQAVANSTSALSRYYEHGGPQLNITAKTTKGDPKEAIIDEAEKWGADLIIVGTHGYSAFERIWLGSVSRAVASQAHCSVRIVRAKKDRKPGMRIVLAVDGSACGNLAVDEVAARPWPTATEVHVISAIHLSFQPTPETWSLPDSYYSQLEKTATDQADAAVAIALERLMATNAGRETKLTIDGESRIGHAEEVIINKAKEVNADLIVIGSHGYRGFKKFLLGSVSQAVAWHSPCSVEVIRGKTIEAD
ncbi:MAG: universal stress protein [Acidobacteria bacterium]|nr:universal stress protein [Acidobacteriota bacterium]